MIHHDLYWMYDRDNGRNYYWMDDYFTKSLVHQHSDNFLLPMGTSYSNVLHFSAMRNSCNCIPCSCNS